MTMIQKKLEWETKFLKLETIYKRRVSTTTLQKLSIPSIVAK